MTKLHYFNHYSNSLNEEEMLNFRAEMGMEGYGVYWALSEIMFTSDKACIHKTSLRGIALNLGIDAERLKKIIDYAIETGVFEDGPDIFYNPQLSENIDEIKERYEKQSQGGKKGAQKRWESYG